MTTQQLVKDCYPNAECILRPFGKEYYWVRNGSTILGQGKNRRCAWKAAYRNIYDH